MADTIVIETPVATVLEVSGKQGPQGVPGATGATGATGPQGPAGTGIETLTTAGDLLYRDNSAATRLPIGSAGQVLKVSNGLPAWANESGAVTSVNGETGAVILNFAESEHAIQHEAGNADELRVNAALVTTVGGSGVDGVYFADGTTTNGKPNYFLVGTRKNTTLQWNNSTEVWELIKNTVVQANQIGAEPVADRPWEAQWDDPRIPQVISSITVTRLGLENMVQKLAESPTNAVATTTQDGLMSAADKTKLNNAVETSRTISAGTGLTGGGDLTANRTLSVSFGSSAGTVAEGNDARLTDSRTPSSHSSSHASTGSDPLAPSDIGAQSLFTPQSQALSADVTLTSGRAVRLTLENYNGTTYNVTLPTTGNQTGDVFIIRTGTLVASQTIRKQNFSDNFTTLVTISQGQSYRFITTGTTSGSWQIDPVFTHTHAASDITSGTLAHERGGLEADVSAYSGLVKISGGSTSAVTVTSAGEALLDDADAAAQRTTLGLGTAATAATGDFAAASHTHELTALAATGATNGHVLTANGSNGATFAALPASGVTGAASSASDVLGVSGSDITGVDATADRIVFWDDSASALKYLEVSTGLSLSGTTLTATASGGTKTYAVFTALDNQPPSTAFATLDTRNSIAVLDFDDATDESAVFVSIIPEGASLGSGLKIRLHWMATTATSGNVVWDVSLERMNTDLDSDSFDTIASGTAAANGTSGILTVTEITLTTIDSVTAGDGFRLKVTRDANNASDTMTGDAELVVCEVRSAA